LSETHPAAVAAGRSAASSASVPETPVGVLKRCFGYESFRPNQQGIVDAVIAGRDALAVMPTGAGKSICYQVPAVILSGVTIVVSPLISLMADQVDSLAQAGISAAYVNSALSPAQQNAVLDQAARGAYALVYVAPERLMTPRFLDFCKDHPPTLLAIDEAHCISQWGQDFRPSYTRISEFLEQLPVRPAVCALTATATKVVRDDILESLSLRDPLVVVASFDRPNLHFDVRHPKSKDAALLSICEKHANQSGIVYCSARKTVEEVCAYLGDRGFSVTRYHAGLSARERKANQEDFVYDRTSIMVATNAFGMGIDKSNVGFVIHYNMPMDVESYYQEAGRAGRDGEPADCVLLYAPKDVHTCDFLIRRSSAESETADGETRARLLDRSLDRLRAMTFYCTTSDCLRAYLLRYFDEQAPSFCGHCGNCETDFEEQDVTVEAQKIASCVYRLGERGRAMGRTSIVDILRGSKSERIVNGGLDTLSTYGIMADVPSKRIRFILDRLIDHGLLECSAGDYPIVTADAETLRFLHAREAFRVKIPPIENRGGVPAERSRDQAPENLPLFAALKELRTDIAAQAGVPAYIVFSNHTLHDMCRRMPANEAELLEVSGVGQVKADRYGEDFLKAIAEFAAR
jgi:ATP-dependent DNA helicase RecQ